MQQISAEIEQVADTILNDFVVKYKDMPKQPVKSEIVSIIGQLQQILFPGIFENSKIHALSYKNRLSVMLEELSGNLLAQIILALRYDALYRDSNPEEIEQAALNVLREFIRKIPSVKEMLESDIEAAYNGDPAAYSKAEIIVSYPGIYAGMIYRLAHELYQLSVPLIPRIMSEYAHSVTGIDIHPGAKIGRYFFMDHGTGIVIGETSVIGDHVKLYQGVTLGALSTKGGQDIKGVKRHPTIDDNVTIYSGASILGGDTVIGKGVTIGGSAFVLRSVPENTRVSVKIPELQYRDKQSVSVGKKHDETEPWYYEI